ncbi:MAG TPA: hypothetical protein VM865_06850 [Acidobacteriaceae bacterium]|jgi:hypothetical protein|nr:hypothetical protein [Acidobacteriaceae bacterium]
MLSRLLALVLLGATSSLEAQQVMASRTMIEAIEQHGSSGTSLEPASTPVPMLMSMHKGWQLMLHSNAFVADTQQQANSPRNKDAFFSTNWIMPMAQRGFGDRGQLGQLTLRAMLSFEPGTVPHRNYPELFQQGETAYGTPIIDGQHPHDFWMELAALYDVKLSRNTLLSFYVAPVGDPAIGPTAYPHRQSASEDPIAALGHHQQDSTHIAFNVVTGGLAYRWARVELSGFHGAEPTEAHWHFEPSSNGHAIDSVATRLTVSPSADWSGQYSFAHITSPEALYPGEDQQRQTASVMYHHTFRSRPFSPHAGMSMATRSDGGATPQGAAATPHDMSHMADMPGMDMSGMSDMGARTPANSSAAPPHSSMSDPGRDSGMRSMRMVPEPTLDFSSTLVWGRTRSLHDNGKQNSYLGEALLRFASNNYLWTRVENAGRSSELLLTPGTPLPPGFSEEPLGHVAAYSLGYDHDLRLGPRVLVAPGAQLTVYRAPEMLRASYGATPTAELFFVRFRLR